MKHPTDTKYRQIVRSKSQEMKSTRLITQMRLEIEELKKDQHPPIPIECFDGYRELEARMTRLERHIFQGINDEDKKDT